MNQHFRPPVGAVSRRTDVAVWANVVRIDRYVDCFHGNYYTINDKKIRRISGRQKIVGEKSFRLDTVLRTLRISGVDSDGLRSI